MGDISAQSSVNPTTSQKYTVALSKLSAGAYQKRNATVIVIGYNIIHKKAYNKN